MSKTPAGRITKGKYLESFTEAYRKTEKSKQWSVYKPGFVYAMTIEFTEPRTIEDAIDYYLSWSGQDDMIEEIQFWKSSSD